MGPYWSHEICGWVHTSPSEMLDSPWAGHGLPLPHVAGPVSPADLVVVPPGASLPEQRGAAAVPVDA